MADFPRQIARPNNQLISTYTSESIFGRAPNLLATSLVAGNTWQSASTAVFVPFYLSEPATAAIMFCMNGTAVSGNVDIGIYDVAGNRLVSMGSTAQSGTSAIQTFNITDTTIPAGTNYLALVLDNATGTVVSTNPGSLVGTPLGVMTQGSAFPLPNPATYAKMTLGRVPLIGFTSRSAL